MNTCFRMYYFLFTTSRHIPTLELLQTAFGNGKRLPAFTRSLSNVQRQEYASALAALQVFLSSLCRDKLATLYFNPSAFATSPYLRADGRRVLTSPPTWRRMSRLAPSLSSAHLTDLRRKELLEVRQVRLFTLAPDKASAFVGSIATRHRIPGTNIYVLRLSARGISLKLSAYGCNPLR